MVSQPELTRASRVLPVMLNEEYKVAEIRLNYDAALKGVVLSSTTSAEVQLAVLRLVATLAWEISLKQAFSTQLSAAPSDEAEEEFPLSISDTERAMQTPRRIPPGIKELDRETLIGDLQDHRNIAVEICELVDE